MLLAKESFKLFEQYLPFLNNKQKQDLYDYYYLIETENQKYNLTGFSDEKLICEGLIESILIFQAITSSILNLDSKVVLDIGSGVGFPILPYFIINPTFNLTIYEPINKRVNFLEMVIAKLNLQNITIKKIRAEDSKETEKFDFISARAVSELKNLMEISHHLLKQNGICCFLK
ncbi:16S rRNA (guanine(527)-N(7))-methyltransferase RsmG [Metamycoplasma arthritidis]|uniref:Ribosomal RNA small subunit methyltransferase G n=2 Tax=Metamycoplasma arthritidis TaxID=2111 RepID=B3PM02_META1|nr:16S rRNA (guanine(527)-N(7))-methyltransferase RsmG [Metamycoplasma arthritidis]ACF07054.1 glucose-inhibited division protein B [Metamycoplasma arthritidis 158L3-1]